MPAPKGGNRGSFKKGNTAALGNDKSLRLSTWLDKALDRPVPMKTKDEYGQVMSYRQYLATQAVDNLITSDLSPKEWLEYFKEISDRTEGKPKQQTDITNSDGSLKPVLVEFINAPTNQD